MTTLSAVATLRPDAVLAFSGDDAQTWLGGQTTNDLTPLFDGQVDAVYTLFVTAKGRILADAWVSRTREGVLVASVPARTAEALAEHFDRYIIMEDVEVERLPLSVVSIVGAEPPTDLLTNHHHHQARDLGLTATHLFLAQGDLKPAMDMLRNSSLDVLDADDWAAAKVATGEPRYGHDFTDEHYPQEAGLGGSAVSFNKGCYIGQEVICMLENRGKFRRQLVHMQLQDLAPGADVCCGDEVVGNITSSATFQGEHFAIAMVARKALDTPDMVTVGGRQPSSLRPIGKAE